MGKDNSERNYDEIVQPDALVKRRGSIIYHDHEVEFETLHTFARIFNVLFDHLPRLYSTRSEQYSIEEFDDEPHSLHDAVRQIGSLIVKEVNELTSTLVIGAYDSSVRTVRSLFEWNVGALDVIMNSTNPNSPSKYPPDFYSLFISCYIKEITRGINDTKQKEQLVRNKIRENVLPKDSLNCIDYAVGGGVTNQIRRLDAKILAIINFQIDNPSPNTNKLLDLYSLLSQYIHMNTKNILEIMPRGFTSFYNKDEFDSSYKIITISLDVILALYIILIDCDVYHCDVPWKKNWRNKTKIMLESTISQNDAFLTTRTLLSSETWNSMSEFAPSITGTYIPCDCKNQNINSA